MRTMIILMRFGNNIMQSEKGVQF